MRAERVRGAHSGDVLLDGVRTIAGHGMMISQVRLWRGAGVDAGFEEGNLSLRLRLHSGLRQRGRGFWWWLNGTVETVPFRFVPRAGGTWVEEGNFVVAPAASLWPSAEWKGI